MIYTQSKIIKEPEGLDENKQYYVAVRATTENLNKLNIAEFEEGLAVQPSVKYGVTCRKNVFGYTEINKNLPKENRCVRTFLWEWKLFNGERQSRIVDVYKDCYPRNEHEPFGIEIQLIKVNDINMLVTKVKKTENIKNTINLYLEVFNYCELLDENFTINYKDINIKRCNWVILPPDLIIEVKKFKKLNKENKSKYQKNYDQARLDALEKYKPLVRYEGLNGFQGYYAYLYKERCILESPIYGNATYVIKKDNWETLSKMTKTELINSGELLSRVEHNKEWINNIANLVC